MLRHPRVTGTPHTGGLTADLFHRSGRLFAANLQHWASGQVPRWAVNAPSPGRSPRACA